MSLKLVETTLNHVSSELRAHYTKQSNGSYKLNVDDLDSYVAPLKSAIAKMKLTEALTSADVRDSHVDLLTRRLCDRVAIDTNDGETTVRILPANGGTLLASGGDPDGASTLDELVAATTRAFPFLFGKTSASSAKKPDVGNKTVSVSEFKALSPLEQRKKIVDEKYQVVDDPKAPTRQPRPGVKEMAREELDKLTPIERARRMNDGWILFD